MACILSKATNSTITRISSKYEVYVAAVPLRGPRGPPQLLMSTIYSLNLMNLQHFMVIINSSSPSDSEAMVCDFQPEDPEDIFTAVAALSGKRIPGLVLTRKLKKLPRKNWFVGYSEFDAVEGRVHEFNSKWGTDLRIGYHDCRNYVNELVEYLTGEKLVLENLRSSNVNNS